jgi:hypothetical protein
LYALAIKGVKIIFWPEKGPKIGFVLHKKVVFFDADSANFTEIIHQREHKEH